MRKVLCKQCGTETLKYDREGSLFCDRKCYMAWKRKHPNKRAYKDKIFVNGYYYLYKPEHPNAIKRGRYIAEHRFILEQKLGRHLERDEVAHHINGDKTDNRQENLELVAFNEHSKSHAKSRKRNSKGQW